MSTSLIAQEPARAILHNDGGVLLNSNPAPNSSAIFLHDVVQTQKGSFAKIDAQGSTVTIQPETVVRFEGEELILEHGSLQVNTSTAMRVRVDCVTVVPLTDEWTRYDVTDVDGKALGVADQNDVKIHYQGTSSHGSKQARFSDVTLHQGEQATREDKCGALAEHPAATDATGTILNSTWAKGAGVAVLGVLACWFLCRGNEPVSPSK